MYNVPKQIQVEFMLILSILEVLSWVVGDRTAQDGTLLSGWLSLGNYN